MNISHISNTLTSSVCLQQHSNLLQFVLKVNLVYIFLFCDIILPHLVCFHRFTNPVTGSVMNDLQPLVYRGLEPVMEACQGQHFSIPEREMHAELNALYTEPFTLLHE